MTYVPYEKYSRLTRLAMVAIRTEDAIKAALDRGWDGGTIEIRMKAIVRHRQLHMLHHRLVDEIMYLLAPGWRSTDV